MDEAAQPRAVAPAKRAAAAAPAARPNTTSPPSTSRPARAPLVRDCHGGGSDLHRDRGAHDDVVAERLCEAGREVRSRPLSAFEVGERLGPASVNFP